MVAPGDHQGDAAVQRADPGVDEVVRRAVARLIHQEGLGDDRQRLGLPLEGGGHGEPGLGIQHQLLLIDVGDVHLVGGGPPADAGVAAEDDPRDAGEGDAERVHRRPAAARNAELGLVEDAGIAQGKMGIVGEDRPSGVGDLAARHPPVAAAPALPPLERLAEQGDLGRLLAIAGRQRRRAGREQEAPRRRLDRPLIPSRGAAGPARRLGGRERVRGVERRGAEDVLEEQDGAVEGGRRARGLEGGEGGGEIDVTEIEREAEGEPFGDGEAVHRGPGVDARPGQLEGRVLRWERIRRIEDVAVDAAGIGIEPDLGLPGHHGERRLGGPAQPEGAELDVRIEPCLAHQLGEGAAEGMSQHVHLEEPVAGMGPAEGIEHVAVGRSEDMGDVEAVPENAHRGQDAGLVHGLCGTGWRRGGQSRREQQGEGQGGERGGQGSPHGYSFLQSQLKDS